MDTKYLKDIAIYIVTAIVSVFVVVYIIIQMTGNFSQSIETLPAMYVTENEIASLDAYIIRNEKILYSYYDGNISYYYTNGSKIQKDAVVATISEGNDIHNEINALEKKIELLKDSSIEDNIIMSDVSTIDTRINKLYNTFRDKIENGDIYYVIKKKDELLKLLNRRQVSLKVVSGWEEKIDELQKSLDNLKSDSGNISDTVISERSGYFYDTIDGYENVFSSVDVNIMTLDDYKKLIEAQPFEIENSGAIGKIALSYDWYIACEILYEDINNFVQGRNYDVIFPYNSDKTINMNLFRVISEPDSERIVLIFKNGIINENFNFLRCQTVDIVRFSYSGYRVPVSAVRIVDGKNGVYILNGSVVEFREINPIFEKNGYFIVEPKDVSNPEHTKRLGLYEKIITKGKDYYDGQILN